MGFLKSLHSWLGKILKLTAAEDSPSHAAGHHETSAATAESGHIVALDHREQIIAADEDLLDRCKTQWQFGDWESLIKVTELSIQNHPDKAKIALLAAAGHQQIGTMQDTHTWVKRAYEWGCKPRLIKQVLISGTHNTLARAAALVGDERRALGHFEAAAETGSRYSNRLVTRVRIESQLSQLGVQAPARISDAS